MPHVPAGGIYFLTFVFKLSGMGRFFYLLVFSICFLEGISQKRAIDSLNAVVKSHPDDSLRLDALRDLADRIPPEQYISFNRLIIRMAAARARCVPRGSRLWRMYLYHAADAHYNSALYYTSMAYPDSALPLYEKCIEISKLAGSEIHIAYCEQCIGLMYTERGRLVEGTKLFYSALKRMEKLGDYTGMGIIYTDIGMLYYKLKNYKKAIENLKLAYQTSEKAGDWQGMTNSLGKLAIACNAIGDKKACIHNLEKSIAVLKQMGDEDEGYREEMLGADQGLLHYWKEEWEEAIPHLKRAIEYAEKSRSLYGQGSNYYHVGLAYEKLKKYPEALAYAKNALELSREKDELYLESQVTQLLYRIYKATGKYTLAFEMNDRSICLHDTIQNREVRGKVLEQQFKYEYEKKELLTKMEQENKLRELGMDAERRSAGKNRWIIILLSGLMLMVGAAFFVYSNYRQKAVIQKQKNKLLKQQLLVSQMNPHFIFNSLNAIQNFIIRQDSLQAGVYLSQFASMIRMILDFSRRDYISLESELKFLNHYLELQQLRTGHAFDYAFDIGEDIEPEMLLVPPMLAQPFIENAIEHGGFSNERRGKIRIGFYRENEMLVCMISDNGIGLKASAEQRQRSEKRHESLATRITLERMETLYHDRINDCRITIEDQNDLDPALSGVKVTFVIPFKET